MAPSHQTVAISGAGGLIGRALAAALLADGWRVVRLVRRPAAAGDEVEWDAVRGVPDPARLAGIEAVVHLAGENIAAGRWTRRRMRAIRDSRVEATRALVASLARLPVAPKAFLCASAIGIYGDRGDEVLTEDSPPGVGFFPDLCRAWEDAAATVAQHGMRWVSLRFGVVLAADGGIVGRMRTPFWLGLGGPLGSGRQYMSWVSRDDAAAIVQRAIADEQLCGPLNVVAAEPVTNREFTRSFARLLRRPAFLPVPAGLLRLIFGRLADEALLASARVIPAVLLRTGYEFRRPRLDDALRAVLGRSA